MEFDVAQLSRAVAREGRAVRVVIAQVRGSSPREAGAAMVVTAGAVAGTIGGGALEHEAIALARALEAPRLVTRALGPELGQCCGGSVVLAFEPYTAADVAALEGVTVVARAVGDAGEMPLALRRGLAAARAQGAEVDVQLDGGWLVEPVLVPARAVWIWGAGHVGRALVTTLVPLPEMAVTWVDTGAERFPDAVPEGVSVVPVADPVRLAAHAPRDAEHIVLTYSHALDLALCDALLRRGFGRAGVIGSATKWARFRNRLAGMGHGPEAVARIACPIGDPALGKHPQAIALGVATQMLRAGPVAVHRGAGPDEDLNEGELRA
ncbi:xanthine dehydrogenase accessory protein XdhC [Pseudooceanicola sp. 502str34]